MLPHQDSRLLRYNMNVPGPVPMMPPGPNVMPPGPMLPQAETATRLSAMSNQLAQPNVAQTILGKGANLLGQILPVAGVLLLTWIGIKMIMTGEGPKIFGGKG